MKLRTFLTSICIAFSALSIKSEAAGFGLGKNVDSQNRPLDAVSFNEQYEADNAYALTSDERRILLTFDQGYENGFTAQILDTLKEKNVTAIFFLTGDYAKSETDLVNRMIDEGHIIGNHSMTHSSFSEISKDAMVEEIKSLHDYVLDKYDYEMQYFRFPCGDYTEESLKCVNELGYKTLFWSFAYVDWYTDNQPDIDESMCKLCSGAHPGAIYLLHSVSSTNAQILGDVIDNLRAQGYTL